MDEPERPAASLKKAPNLAVMLGLVPGIHVFLFCKTWMAGTRGVNDAVFDGYARP